MEEQQSQPSSPSLSAKFQNFGKSVISLRSMMSNKIVPMPADTVYVNDGTHDFSRPITGQSTGSLRTQDDIMELKDNESSCLCWYKFKQGIRGAWATRHTEDLTENKDLFVKTTLRELFTYIMFLVLLMIIAFGMLYTNIFYFTKVIQESYSNKDFNAITSTETFWNYISDPLLKNLFWEDYWYNQRPNTSNDFIFFESKLLGFPQIRQLKITNNSCIIPKPFESLIPGCYDSFAPFILNRTTFGPGNTSAWQYTESEDSSVDSSYSGVFGTYPKGGYIQMLPRNLSASTDIINELKSNLWVDHGTRVVFIDFTLYNANINLFCVAKMVFEFPPTGGVYPKFNIRTVKLIRYLSTTDYFIMGCEFLYLCFLAYYVIEEVIEIKRNKLKYFTEVWNVLDILVILISVVCAIFNIYRTVYVNNRLDQVLKKQDSYVDFDFISYWQKLFRESIAVTVFLAVVKIFKYISFNKTMNQLTDTLGNSMKDLAGFAVMFFIFFFAFAQCGYFMFGSLVIDFREFEISVFTLFRIILGDFDFQSLVQAHSFLGPLYFITYVFLVFFILINMFVVIINDSYVIVKENIANYKQDFQVSTYLSHKILNRLKKDKIIKIQEVLEKASIMNQEELSFMDWRNELQKHGYADVEIQALFLKYDIDHDLMLDYEERSKMLQDLKDRKVTIGEAPEENAELPEAENNAEAEEDTEVSEGQISDLVTRLDRVELGVIEIVSKIDKILGRLSSIEQEKLECQRNIGYSLDILTGSKSSLQT